jgi:excisionase family DNA binding protein
MQSETVEVKRRVSRREPAKPLAVGINEACRIGGFGRTKCYELIQEQKLKTVAIGRKRLIVYSTLEELLRPSP